MAGSQHPDREEGECSRPPPQETLPPPPPIITPDIGAAILAGIQQLVQMHARQSQSGSHRPRRGRSPRRSPSPARQQRQRQDNHREPERSHQPLRAEERREPERSHQPQHREDRREPGPSHRSPRREREDSRREEEAPRRRRDEPADDEPPVRDILEVSDHRRSAFVRLGPQEPRAQASQRSRPVPRRDEPSRRDRQEPHQGRRWEYRPAQAPRPAHSARGSVASNPPSDRGPLPAPRAPEAPGRHPRPGASSPFSAEILAFPIPTHFDDPVFTRYTGTQDPTDHINDYYQAMVRGRHDFLLCKFFPSSLSGAAAKWFARLPEGSVTCFDDLSRAFYEHYEANRQPPRNVQSLFILRMGPKESLKDFNARFRNTLSSVELSEGLDAMAAVAFRNALPTDHRCYEELAMEDCQTMLATTAIANRFIKLEADRSQPFRARGAHHAESSAAAAARAPIPAARRALAPQPLARVEPVANAEIPARRAIGMPPDHRYRGFLKLNQPIARFVELLRNRPYFVHPDPLPPDAPGGRIPELYCNFHRSQGHSTGRCLSLRNHLQDLVEQGYLAEFVVEPRRNETPPPRRARVYPVHPPAGEGGLLPPPPPPADHLPPNGEVLALSPIATISGSLEAPPSNRDAKRQRRLVEEYARSYPTTVHSVGANGIPLSRKGAITFSEADTAGIRLPCTEPLVVHLLVANRMVSRILIDTGSAVDLIFAAPFLRLGIPESALQEVYFPLFGFTGEPATTLGAIDLSVTIGPETHTIKFAVVHATSAYNVILGRGFLARLMAVPSTAHAALKFITTGGKVVTIRSDQAAAVACVQKETQLHRRVDPSTRVAVPVGTPPGFVSPHILPNEDGAARTQQVSVRASAPSSTAPIQQATGKAPL